MASLSQMAARLVDLFGPAATANPAELYGNLMVSPNGNILIGSVTDDGLYKLQVTGTAYVTSSTRVGGALEVDGALSVTGQQTNTAGIQVAGFNVGSLGQLVMTNGNYGAGWRNDGNNCYALSTASGSPSGSYNSYRPFYWSLSTGTVNIDGTGEGTVFANGTLGTDVVAVGGNIVTGGYRCRAGVGGAIDNVFNFYWVGGAIQCWIDYTNVGSIAFSSDSRIKQNVRDYRGGLDSVMKMRIVRYEYKNEGIFEADGRVHEGFIAQELRKILPSAVDGDPTATTPSVEHTEFGPVPKQTPQPLSLRPLPIIAVTVQAVQELAEMVEQQGKQIQELQAALASIQGRTQ